MNDFTIALDTASFARTSRGNAVTGKVCLWINGEAFPEKDWNDFVSIVVSWWGEAVLAIANGSSRASLRFMDGPFEASIFRDDNQSVKIRAVAPRGAVLESEVSIQHVKAEIAGAAKAVLDYCTRHQIESDDIGGLHRLTGMLSV